MTQKELYKQFDDFLWQFNNQSVEVVDPTSPYQCFDLVVGWCDYIDIPRVFPFLYAYQIFTNFGAAQAKYFDRIYNEKDNAPQKGDIVVWSYYYNFTAGHTGIATGKGQATGTANDWFQCFAQNDPTGYVSRLINYKYSNVLGWLRPKVSVAPPPPNADPQVNEAKKAQQSALNFTTTALQVGDPQVKQKLAQVKQQAKQVFDMI